MAGGDSAVHVAVEGAEDDGQQGWKDLQAHRIDPVDCRGHRARWTPYVLGALQARKQGLLTGCVACNPQGAIVDTCDHAVVATTGPEFVTGAPA